MLIEMVEVIAVLVHMDLNLNIQMDSRLLVKAVYMHVVVVDAVAQKDLKMLEVLVDILREALHLMIVNLEFSFWFSFSALSIYLLQSNQLECHCNFVPLALIVGNEIVSAGVASDAVSKQLVVADSDTMLHVAVVVEDADSTLDEVMNALDSDHCSYACAADIGTSDLKLVDT